MRIVIVVLALGCASVAADGMQTGPYARDWPAWHELVVSHTPGERDLAVDRLSQWTRGEVDRMIAAVSRLPPEERAPVVARALVLHTDVALFNRTPTGYSLPESGTESLLYADGQQVGVMSGTFHWDRGRQLIERLPRGDERLRIARAYYRGSSAVLQFWGEHTELQRHLAAAARILGPDPVILLYEGTQHQVYADPRSQRFFEQRRQDLRDDSPLGVTGAGRTDRARVMAQDLPPTAETARTNAERAFREALSLDPSLDEARVRLAHVLYDRGQYDDAAGQLALLAAAPGTSSSAFLDYYTTMVTGRVARALNRFDEATTAFERGLALQANAQAPRVALSELAMARGDAATASRYLMPLAAGAGIDDPWWRIGRTHEAPTSALVIGMWEDLTGIWRDLR